MESGSSRYSEIFLDNLQNVTCCTPTRKQEIHNHSVCYFSFRKTFSPPNRSSILTSMGSKPQTTLRDRYIYAQTSAAHMFLVFPDLHSVGLYILYSVVPNLPADTINSPTPCEFEKLRDTLILPVFSEVSLLQLWYPKEVMDS